jgi:predicted metal-dependent phosphoesterase TrpH
MKHDLHCHSSFSDGALTPSALCERAAKNGVTHLSVTDHDTLAAFDESNPRCIAGVQLIPGIELSTQWRGMGVHIVGLNIDPQNGTLRRGVASQQVARHDRAEKIARRLERLGIAGSRERVFELAGGGAVGRPHFARYLVEIGVVSDETQAFRKYLGNGKPAAVRADWASLQDVTEWIVAAGGTAVIAHPAYYRMTRSKLIRMIDEFAEAGGRAIEVISGHQQPSTTARMARIAIDYSLFASCGSDFHAPDPRRADLGKFGTLPQECQPVWTSWDIAA